MSGNSTLVKINEAKHQAYVLTQDTIEVRHQNENVPMHWLYLIKLIQNAQSVTKKLKNGFKLNYPIIINLKLK